MRKTEINDDKNKWYILLSVMASCSAPKDTGTLDSCNVVATQAISHNDTLWVADMNKITQTVTIPLSFLLSDWRLMKLEGSSKEMMVSPINGIYPSENHLISDDSNNGVLLFDKKGNFECSVAKIGSGPADIEPGVTGIQIDETKGVIYLTTGYRDKMKMYALRDAAFLGEIPLSFRTILPSYIVNSHDSTILITDVPMKDAPVVLWKQDFHGNKFR